MIKEVALMMNPSGFAFAQHVAYEWAEDIAKVFDVPVSVHTSLYRSDNPIKSGYFYVKDFFGKKFTVVRKVIGYFIRQLQYHIAPVPPQNINSPMTICILMAVSEMTAYRNINSLLIFTDVWEKEIDYVIRYARKHTLFYVTSRYIFNRIKSECPDSRVHYMPLSVSDRHYSCNFDKYRHKNIDVVQFGRKDPALHEYMLRYAAEHGNIDYVYSSAGRESEYISTLRGNLGYIEERADFIKLLSSTKISLVSSPGMYKGYTYGCCFVTPRFYESAILGCALIGRYPDNEEFTELNMRRYCPHITSYEHFCIELERALAQTPEELYAQNHDFIINSLTSKRAEQIQRDLESLS